MTEDLKKTQEELDNLKTSFAAMNSGFKAYLQKKKDAQKGKKGAQKPKVDKNGKPVPSDNSKPFPPKEAKADMPMPSSNDDGDGPDVEDLMDNLMDNLWDMVCGMCDNLQNQVNAANRTSYAAHDKIYDHANGGTHLPPIIGADKMTKALKTLGLDGDYSVNKRQIYSSINKNTLEVNYFKPAK